MAEKLSDYPNSLVRYQKPVLMVNYGEKKDAKKEVEDDEDDADILVQAKNPTEEILNIILPPRCWEEDGQLWCQSVSTLPATREDVAHLQETLDIQLQLRQARATGICPVRRELYSECFDELIRQITINCAERGILLLRMRDELLMSLEAYETIYSSSTQFGIRKAILAEEEMGNLKDKVKALEVEHNSLLTTISNMEITNEINERRNIELRAADEKMFNEEINFLKKTNMQFKTQLEGIIALKK